MNKKTTKKTNTKKKIEQKSVKQKKVKSTVTKAAAPKKSESKLTNIVLNEIKNMVEKEADKIVNDIKKESKFAIKINPSCPKTICNHGTIHIKYINDKPRTWRCELCGATYSEF